MVSQIEGEQNAPSTRVGVKRILKFFFYILNVLPFEMSIA